MSYLDKILAATERRVGETKRRVPYTELEMAARRVGHPKEMFSDALRGPQISIIGEYKRRSPSAGLITERTPSEVARAYVEGGASAMSVLCEPDFFGGSYEDFTEVRDSCELPLLVKDFIIDPYQLVEARVHGAQAVLLIASALEGSRLSELVDFAISQELDPLVEVHDATELKRAVSTRARMIGINQRDLTTFELDLSLAIDLRPSVPTDRVVIAESGVNTPDQVRELAEANLDAVLIGESLLRSDDLALAVRAMIAH